MTTLHTLLLDISKLPEESVGPGIMARVREELKGMTPTDADVRGDLLHRLAKFSDEALESAFEGQDFDGGQAQETAIKHGLLVLVKFDPEAHDDRGVGLEAGDDFYEYAPDFSEALSSRPLAGEAVRSDSILEHAKDSVWALLFNIDNNAQGVYTIEDIRYRLKFLHDEILSSVPSAPTPPQQGETSEGVRDNGEIAEIEASIRKGARRSEHRFKLDASTPDAIDEAMVELGKVERGVVTERARRLMQEFYLSDGFDPRAKSHADVVAAAIEFALNDQIFGCTDAWSRIVKERRRQFEDEKWDFEHDDEHEDGALLRAAIAYLHYGTEKQAEVVNGAPLGWPWESKFWKPKDRIINLERAGALCLAERERIFRKKMPVPSAVDPRKKREWFYPNVAHVDQKLNLTISALQAALEQSKRKGG